jgi:hypothetical protein
MNQLSDSLTRRATDLFKSLGDSLSDTLTLGVAFRTLALRTDSATYGICGKPQVGTSTTGGADDGRTRFYRYKLLGLFPVGLEEGGPAISRRPTGCHREKRVFLNRLTRNHGLPEYAQITLARIGDHYLGTVPVEPTTMAGAEMQRAIGSALGFDWATARQRITIVALTNGFLQYLTTRAEYAMQGYEGGSTLFGPNESQAFAAQLGVLATALAGAAGGSPANVIDSIMKYPGKPTRVLPSDSLSGPVPDPMPHWVACRGDTVVGRWTGVYPIQLHLDKGPIVRIEAFDGGAWRTAAQDDDRELEIRSIAASKRGWTYELRWVPRGIRAPFRFQVLDSAGATIGGSSDQCTPSPVGTPSRATPRR